MIQRRNFFFLWARDALIVAAASFSSASILSAFFLRLGLTEREISLYLALVPMIDLLTSLCFSGITSKTKKTIWWVSALCAVSGGLTCLYSVFALISFSPNLLYTLILLLGAALSGVTSLRVVFGYKVPCEVIPPDRFSSYQSISGIIGGGLGVLAGLLASFLFSRYDVLPASAVIMVAGGISLFAASACNAGLRPIVELKHDENVANTLSSMAASVLKDRRFLWMIGPNFIRGIGAGIVSILPIIAASALSLSGSEISRITVFTYIATPIGCLLYVFLSRRIGPAGTVVIGGVLFSSFALMFLRGPYWFYAVYCIAYVGYTVVCYVIPEIIFKNTDAHRISTFQSLRMVLTTLGTTLSAAFFGNLIGTVSPTVLSAVGTVSILFCSVCYWFCYHKSK